MERKDDFSALASMRYSGRGIVIGMTPKGEPFVGYSLTGRSLSSQARKLIYDELDHTVRTEVTDLEQLRKGNPALLIYQAIIPVGDKIVASNGLQTKFLRDMVMLDKIRRHPANILVDAFTVSRSNYISPPGQLIDLASYEPDAPNFTPRISAGIDEFNRAAFCIIKNLHGSAELTVHPFRLELKKARMITTYKGGNESPLLPFEGSPLEIAIGSTTAHEICESIYEAIGPKGEDNFRVASAVMLLKEEGTRMTPSVAVINRCERGQ
jgi:IMP cyclohydrolase